MVPKRKSRKEAKRRSSLLPIEKEMMAFFERGIGDLKSKIRSMPPGLAKNLALDELRLRERRLRQWRRNPSGGVPVHKRFKPVTPSKV